LADEEELANKESYTF